MKKNRIIFVQNVADNAFFSKFNSKFHKMSLFQSTG